MQNVIVLNADMSYLNTVSWQDAVTLVYLRKAEILKESDRIISNFDRSFQMFIPMVLKLTKFVKAIFKPRTGFNKRNVMFRDKMICQYCGNPAGNVDKNGDVIKMTIDHVMPSSRGGKSTYENCVTACEKCNHDKADRTPEEARMKLRRIPQKPNIADFFRQQMHVLGIDTRLKELGVF